MKLILIATLVHLCANAQEFNIVSPRNSSVWLPCPGNVANILHVEWTNILQYNTASGMVTYFNNLSDSKYIYSRNSRSLTVLSTQFSDERRYRCSIYNGTETTIFTTLHIYAPPTSVTMSPISEANEASQLSLMCHVASVYPNNTQQIRFLVGTTRVCNVSPVYANNADGTKRADAQCLIQLNRTAHGQTAKCEAQFQFNGINQVVESSNSYEVNVHFNPRLMTLTSSARDFINEGTSVSLMCITDEANPTANVTWSWNGTDGVPGHVLNTAITGDCCGGAMKRRSERTISAHKSHNLKSFTCTSSSISDSLTLQVKFKPTSVSIVILTSMAVTEDSTLRFRCTTDTFNPSSSLTNLAWKINTSALNNATSPVSSHASSSYGGYTSFSVVTFPATREHNGQPVSCHPAWDGNSITVSQPSGDTVTVIVYYLPQISINGGGVIHENTCNQLTCSITGGNPSNVAQYTFKWFWKAIGGELETRLENNQQTLPLISVTYQQSGLYRCEAQSVAGTATEDVWLNITYAPVGINVVGGNKKIIYASYNESSELILTVHSFPAGSHVVFTWSKGNIVRPSQMESSVYNQTESTVHISSVSESDHGNYTVEVTNGENRVSTFYVELILHGKPTPVLDIRTVSVSYREIVISFHPGMDGRFTQTLSVMYKKEPSSINYINAGNIVDPEHDVQIDFTIVEDIESSTRYEIVIFSDNNFTGPATRSNPYLVTTKARPSVQAKDLQITRSGDEFILRWPEIYLDAGDSLVVQQCGGECLNHDVSGRSQGTFHKANGTAFSLLYYQGLDLVSNLEFKEEKDTTSNTGVIAGSVISVIFIAVLTSLGLLYWRKLRTTNRKKSDANVYMITSNNREIDNSAQIYDESLRPSGEYTSLTALRSVCDNFLLSKNVQTDIIYSGHFLTYQCRFEDRACAVKTLKGDASHIHEVKWILAQSVAMKNLPLHRNIAEIVVCNSNIETPLLVTTLADKGDLKSALTSCDRNTSDGIIVSVRNALDIVEGMHFLSKYQLLNYELSTSHVLLGHNDECKIINFASAESVRARQKISLKLNDMSCVPWLAPECLISAEQHCTASDVWSFGVLLYEIIVSGGNPYKEMSLDEIGEFVLQGKTLDIPVEGQHFGEIINKCWNFEPAERPDWTQQKEMLIALHAQFAVNAGVYETVRFEGP